MANVIEVKNLNKAFKTFALKNVNITVPQGTVMGFVGENGAGKSTTIKAILNLIFKDSGEITVLGQTLTDKDAILKEQIGVVLDESFFHDSLTAKQVSLIMKNVYTQWNEDVFFSYIERFELPPTQAVKEYSRGMKMKLSIAVALSHGAKLLILDEATSGLDPIIRNQILDIFLEFIQEENHSIFISSHITSDLEKICDYITFIHKGEIVFTESKDDLHDNYGIAKCEKEKLETLNKETVETYKENMFGCELLTNNRSLFEKQNPGIMVEHATIEDVMLYYVEGKRI